MNEDQINELYQRLESKIEQLFEKHYAKIKADRVGGIDLAMEVTGLKRPTIYKRVGAGMPHSKDGKLLWFSETELRNYMMKTTTKQALKPRRGRKAFSCNLIANSN